MADSKYSPEMVSYVLDLARRSEPQDVPAIWCACQNRADFSSPPTASAIRKILELRHLPAAEIARQLEQEAGAITGVGFSLEPGAPAEVIPNAVRRTVATQGEWTLAQTVVWVLTRDMQRVDAVPPSAIDDGLPEDSALMEEMIRIEREMPANVAWPVAYPVDEWKQIVGRPGVSDRPGGYRARGDVFGDLIGAAERGLIAVTGRAPDRTADQRTPIAAGAWMDMDVQSMPDGATDRATGKLLFCSLRFQALEVVRQWPSPSAAPDQQAPTERYAAASAIGAPRKPRWDEKRSQIMKAVREIGGDREFKQATWKERCRKVERHLSQDSGWCTIRTLQRAFGDMGRDTSIVSQVPS